MNKDTKFLIGFIIIMFIFLAVFFHTRRKADYKAIDLSPLWKIEQGKVLVRDADPEQYKLEIARLVELGLKYEDIIRKQQGKKGE